MLQKHAKNKNKDNEVIILVGPGQFLDVFLRHEFFSIQSLEAFGNFSSPAKNLLNVDKKNKKNVHEICPNVIPFCQQVF